LWAGPIGCSGSLDGDLGIVWLLLDQVDVLAAELADADDAVPVADVAVVEDKVVRGGVVADVIDVGVITRWNPVRGEGPG
jgi:hypothetical protein